MESYQIVVLVLGIIILPVIIIFVLAAAQKVKIEKNEEFKFDLKGLEHLHGKIIAIWVKYEKTDYIKYESSGFGFMQNGIGFYSGPGTEYKKNKIRRYRSI